MNAATRAAAAFSAEIAHLSAEVGRRVNLTGAVLTERAALFGLGEPGAISANGSCRMVRARDGWIVVNLPRESDLDSVPAWIGCDPGRDMWGALAGIALGRPGRALVEDAQQLGLAAALVGSVSTPSAYPPQRRFAAGGAARNDWGGKPPKVIDMSSLWAGPLCGGVLAAAGAKVIKLESTGRPDTTGAVSPAFDERLNGGKTRLSLDFSTIAGRERLQSLVLGADVLITSARPRAFDQLDLSPSDIFAANPALVWVAITAYGWEGQKSLQVGFGDDAAAAGGLVEWRQGEPRFLGDAVADPLTGLIAAIGTFQALQLGGGCLVDAALANTAAGVAACFSSVKVAS